MVDTARSLSEVYTLLADNTTQQISAQDVRDTVKTLAAGHGEIYIATPTETTITDTTSWFPAAGTFALSANAMNWDMNTNGQLRYTGTPDRICHIAMSVSMTAASNNQVIHMTVAKNGTAIDAAVIHNKIGTGADVVSTALHAFVSVSTNDYLTAVVKNTTSASNVTVTTCNLFSMSMAM